MFVKRPPGVGLNHCTASILFIDKEKAPKLFIWGENNVKIATLGNQIPEVPADFKEYCLIKKNFA